MGNRENPGHVVTWTKKEWDEEQKRKAQIKKDAFKFTFKVMRFIFFIWIIIYIIEKQYTTAFIGFVIFILIGGWIEIKWVYYKIKRLFRKKNNSRRNNGSFHKSIRKPTNHKKKSHSKSSNYKKSKSSNYKKKGKR